MHFKHISLHSPFLPAPPVGFSLPPGQCCFYFHAICTDIILCVCIKPGNHSWEKPENNFIHLVWLSLTLSLLPQTMFTLFIVWDVLTFHRMSFDQTAPPSLPFSFSPTSMPHFSFPSSCAPLLISWVQVVCMGVGPCTGVLGTSPGSTP